MPQETSLERELLHGPPLWIERAVGVVALLVGLILATLLIPLVWSPRSNTQIPAEVMVLIGVIFSLALFFFNASARLLLQLPNSYGSLFAPWVWFTFSTIFLALPILFALTATWQYAFNAAQAITSSLLLSLLSYGVGSHFRRKRRPTKRAA